MMMIYLLTAIG